jgi:hypothetical protein
MLFVTRVLFCEPINGPLLFLDYGPPMAMLFKEVIRIAILVFKPENRPALDYVEDATGSLPVLY